MVEVYAGKLSNLGEWQWYYEVFGFRVAGLDL